MNRVGSEGSGGGRVRGARGSRELGEREGRRERDQVNEKGVGE